MNRSFQLLWLLVISRIATAWAARHAVEAECPHPAPADDFSESARDSASRLTVSEAIYLMLPDQLRDLWRRPGPKRAAELVRLMADAPGAHHERTLATAASLLRQFDNDGEAAAALGNMLPTLQRSARTA